MDKACMAPICLTCQIGKAPSDSAQLSFLQLVEICPSSCAWETIFAKSHHHLLQGLYHTTINCCLDKPTSSSELPSSLALLDASSSCRYKERVPSKIPSSLHTADNKWFSTKTQNLNHPHLIRRSEISHSKDKIVLVPKPKSSILLTSTYLIFELWNSHTTDNSLEPEPKSSILLASSFLIFSFVKFTYHRHCSGTKIHWQCSCTQRQELLPHWIIPDFQGMKFTHHRKCGCTKIQKDPRTWFSSSCHSWCLSCERDSHLEDKCSCAEIPRAQLSSSHHSLCSNCERKSHPADNCSC